MCQCVVQYICVLAFTSVSIYRICALYVRGETRSCICSGANLHHSCSYMYVLGAGGVKGVSEHLEEFRHGLGMLCYRTLNVLRIVFEMYTERPEKQT